MKVKIFQEGIFSEGSGLERNINTWLAEHPEIKIVDIRLSAVNENYAQGICLILYQE